MVMKSFTPVWHPSIAANYFTLYNDLNKTNNILYYDNTNAFISYPKVFTYNRTNSTNNFKLTKVITNSNSDNPTYSNTLPSTSGTFTINKIAPDSGNSAPTIDLYCSGDIQIVKTYDIDNHAYGEVVISSISPSTYDTGNNNYSLNQSLTINYYTNYGFGDGYEYSHLWVKATINWGKDSSGNLVSNGTANSNGNLILSAPSSYVSDVVPTITIWMQLYSKQSSGGGGGDQPSTYVEISQSGIILGNTYIRESPDINSGVVASVVNDSNAYFTLRTQDSSWYFSSWDGGWVSSSRIRF